MAIQGQRCKLLGNPPKQKSGNGTGDKRDGCAIAVTPAGMEYHSIGSLIAPGTKCCGKLYPIGGIWVHVYRRTRRGSDTFKYESSHVFVDDKGTGDDDQKARDAANMDKLMG